MNKLYIAVAIIISFIFSYQNSFSQSINGKITHSHNQIEFATIRLYSLIDSNKIVNAVITDSSGSFVFNNLTVGNYFIKISCIGYLGKKIPLMLDENHQNISFKEIELISDNSSLNAVIVTAQKQFIKKTQNGFVVSAKDNISQASGTATDLLRNIPTVVVDEDGNISIRGKSPLVLINGRSSSLSSTGRIPASSIESIEIINNPSAKYDADAEGGIINITLKKNTGNGTNGSVALGGGIGAKGRINSAFIINHREGKWNFGLSYDNRFAVRRRKGEAERMNYFLIDQNDLLQNRNDNRLEQTQNLKFNVDFNPNKNNLISLEVLGNLDGENNHETLVSQMNKQNDIFNFKNSRHSDEFVREKAIEGSLNYLHKFNEKGKKLSIKLSSAFNFDRENTDINTQSLDSTNNSLNNPLIEQTHDYQNNNVSNLQIDYTQPVGLKSSFETGYKGISRFTNADFQSSTFNNNAYIINSKASNLFHFNEQIHAAYFLFKSVIGKLNDSKLKYDIGLRLEQVWNNGSAELNDISFKNAYLNYFPSLNIAYYVKPNDFFKLSFSRRINRPNLGQLNPFVDITDSLNPHGGNPYLKPELANSMEFGFNKEWKKYSSVSTFFYRYSTDIIRPFISLDTNGVALVKPRNYGNATTYGFEEILSAYPTKFYNSNLSISLFQQKINGSNVSSDALSNYFSWYCKMINNFSICKGGKLQLIANYNSPIATPQGTRVAVYNVDGGYQQKLLKGKAALGLVITDIFNTQRSGLTALSSDFNYHRNFKADTRAILLTFTYSFKTAIKEELLENKFSND